MAKKPKNSEAPVKTATIDIDTFMESLDRKCDTAKLGKALLMLKAERFQLFSQIEKDSLVGVVKSQTNADLVYSCRLASDGSFSCCTQNLRPCGGLRGSLCKHLLVLVVGLTKGGELDPAAVDEWVAASRKKRPDIDEGLMS